MRLLHRTLAGLAVASATAVLAPAALASSTPSIAALTPSTTQAAATNDNLALNLAFANDASDSPKNLTINLPPGLLADTTLTDSSTGQPCLSETTNTNSGCQLGSGTVTTDVPALLGAQLNISADFYLVAPPNPGDLAGLYVYSPTLGSSLGTGDILIRPSGSAAGVGATIKLTLPQQVPASALGGLGGLLGLATIQVKEIDSTFDNLRNPATCGPATVSVSSTSYAGDSESTSGAFTPTGCANLAFNPQFSASAVRDSADKGVSVTTDITQTPSEAPNAGVSLSFPTNMFGANLATLPNLCANPASGSCKAVGTVRATSPLYAKTLTGAAYLSGNASGLTLVLTFPSPFPLTLTGQVNLNTNTASFSGLPDIPLTDLNVTLNGGSNSLFVATCQASAGNATAALTAQNGAAKTLTAAISYTGCPADNPPKGTLGGSGSGGSGSGSGSSGGSGATTVAPTTTAKIVAKSAKGLDKGRPSVTFKVRAGRKAAKLTRLTISLPHGLSFRSHRHGKAKLVTGITLSGARSRSAKLSGHKLVIVFKTGSRSVKVRLGPKALKESKALEAKAARKALKKLILRVEARNTKHRIKSLRARITELNLG